MRSEELLDVLRVAFRHDPDSEHREQRVGQHLLLGAVCEHEVADQHAADEVADDRPGDDLHDEAGATLRANGLSEYEAKSGSREGAGEAPEHDENENAPEKAPLALTRFGEDAAQDIEK